MCGRPASVKTLCGARKSGPPRSPSPPRSDAQGGLAGSAHLRYASTQSTAMMPSRLAMTRVASAGGR